MSGPDARSYEVRVAGLVPLQDLTEAFGDVELSEHEVRTVLTGRFVDQAELYGFLHRLRSYGLQVVEVRRVPVAEADPPEAPDPELGVPEEPRP